MPDTISKIKNWSAVDPLQKELRSALSSKSALQPIEKKGGYGRRQGASKVKGNPGNGGSSGAGLTDGIVKHSSRRSPPPSMRLNGRLKANTVNVPRGMHPSTEPRELPPRVIREEGPRMALKPFPSDAIFKPTVSSSGDAKVFQCDALSEVNGSKVTGVETTSEISFQPILHDTASDKSTVFYDERPVPGSKDIEFVAPGTVTNPSPAEVIREMSGKGYKYVGVEGGKDRGNRRRDWVKKTIRAVGLAVKAVFFKSSRPNIESQAIQGQSRNGSLRASLVSHPDRCPGVEGVITRNFEFSVVGLDRQASVAMSELTS